jgi:hypothetical protein
MLREVTMTVAGKLARKIGFLVGMALVLSALVPSARAQYACPAGYYYDPTYGCVPNTYQTWPYYAYPDYGFDFFYGPGWGGRWGGYHGGGRVYGGGGYHGGGGGRGGGGHGGGGFHR